MKKIKILIFTAIHVVILLLSNNNDIFAQDRLGNFRDVKVLDNLDTLYIDRQVGQWWFGPTGGPNFDLYFGDLFVPRDPYSPQDSINVLIAFPGASDFGYNFGLMGEFNPRGADWGLGLIARIIDVRQVRTTSASLGDSLDTRFTTENINNYVTISPYFKYKLPAWGLYAMIGLDFEYSTSYEGNHYTEFYHGSPIDFVRRLDKIVNPEQFRFGGHLGIANDFLVADVSNSMRVYLTPYITLNLRTIEIKDFESSWNSLMMRAGISFKIGPDKINEERKQFDLTYVPPPAELAQVREDRGIEFSGFRSSINYPLPEILAVAVPEIAEDIAEASRVNEQDRIITKKPRIVKSTVEISPNEETKFYYQTAEITKLSQEMQEYLNIVADYVKGNPTASVRIVGHSDNQGTFDQNEKRAYDRAQQAVRYLVAQGVPRGRIFDRGDGARSPKGDNRTDAGRMMNRRIEVVVVQ